MRSAAARRLTTGDAPDRRDAPLPSPAVAAAVHDMFGLTAVQAAGALWHRGCGGDGRCELAAAMGDRVMALFVAEEARDRGGADSEAAVARYVEAHCNRTVQAAVARRLGVADELTARGAWGTTGGAPSDHTVATVLEALFAACYDVHGAGRTRRAVAAHITAVAALSPRPPPPPPAAVVARETAALGLPPVVFVTRPWPDGSVAADAWVFDDSADGHCVLRGTPAASMRAAVEDTAAALLRLY